MKLAGTEIKKIGIFRALQLGDLLCTIPAIRALRHAYPNSEITLIGLPWAKSFVERFPAYFNSFIHFSGFPGLPEQNFNPKDFADFLHNVQNENFDLIFQMQGNGSIVNPMVELFGAKHIAGFYIQGHYYPSKDLFIEYPGIVHEIERHLQLMHHLGIAQQGTYLEFPLTEKDHKDLEEAKVDIGSSKYICVHPGSRGISRRWPVKYFARLADLGAEKGYKVVITGTKEEIALAYEIENLMEHRPIIASGKTNLGAVGVLIKNSDLLISNCTGVSHIASALKTPSVVISLDGEAKRWGPLDTELHKVIDWTTEQDYNLVFNKTEMILNKNIENA
jgi:ADP-heptose:LPS heptosyltransferase